MCSHWLKFQRKLPKKSLGRFDFYYIVGMFIRCFCTSFEFSVPIEDTRSLHPQFFVVFFYIEPYGKMNKSYFLETTNMIASKFYMNGH